MISLNVSLVMNPWPCKRSKKLGDDLSQCIVGNESLALPIVQLKGVFKLFLHFFQWRILHKESCTKLTKLSEFNLSRSILINFMEKVSKLLLSWSEAHGPHDLSQIISRQELLLFCVEQIKANLQALNFISSEVGQVVDLLKVNISIRISPAHGDTSGVLFLLAANSYSTSISIRISP